MIRPATLFWLVLIAIASAFVFVTGRQVDALDSELDRVNRAIVRESEAIRVLRSEWSYLNQPDRLRALAAEMTDLEPAAAEQIIPAAITIPYPLPQPGEVLTLTATRIPGFEQLPMPARPPSLGPLPAGSVDGVSAQSPDLIGALLASLDGAATAAMPGDMPGEETSP